MVFGGLPIRFSRSRLKTMLVAELDFNWRKYLSCLFVSVLLKSRNQSATACSIASTFAALHRPQSHVRPRDLFITVLQSRQSTPLFISDRASPWRSHSGMRCQLTRLPLRRLATLINCCCESASGISGSVRMYLGNCFMNFSVTSFGISGISVRWFAITRIGSIGRLICLFSSHFLSPCVSRSSWWIMQSNFSISPFGDIFVVFPDASSNMIVPAYFFISRIIRRLGVKIRVSNCT